MRSTSRVYELFGWLFLFAAVAAVWLAAWLWIGQTLDDWAGVSSWRI